VLLPAADIVDVYDTDVLLLVTLLLVAVEHSVTYTGAAVSVIVVAMVAGEGVLIYLLAY